MASLLDIWLDTLDSPDLISPQTIRMDHGAFSPRSDSGVESTTSGWLSAVWEIGKLSEEGFIFRSFKDTEAVNVTEMLKAVQELSDGIGIVAYDEIPDIFANESLRLKRPGVNNSLTKLIRQSSTKKLQTSKEEWNEDVHYLVLNLVLETSIHQHSIKRYNIKTARVAHQLVRGALPRRVIDYVFALKPDHNIAQAFKHLQPIYTEARRSWNHATHITDPIAIPIETKAMMTSWTDGIPQMAIWIDAWLSRLRLLKADIIIPSVPILIAQGHDWFMLIITQSDGETIVRDKIDIGGTRNAFDALKRIAVLHWLLDWAEMIWRPWFKSLLSTATPAQTSVSISGSC